MSNITLNDFEIPATCDKCGFIGRYEGGLYVRNPHCCCELIWQLKGEDYKVDKNSLDENCPLKMLNEHIHHPDDFVQIVRCKDCINAVVYTDQLEGENGLRCPLWGAAGIDPNGFCHLGKVNTRKKNPLMR